MGFIGIFFTIGSVVIIIYILIDVYLGAPRKPRTIIAAITTCVIGVALIYFDYYFKPYIYYYITYSNRYQFIDKGKTEIVNRPIKIKLFRKVYPSFIVLRRSRVYADVYHLDKEVPDEEQFKIEEELEGLK